MNPDAEEEEWELNSVDSILCSGFLFRSFSSPAVLGLNEELEVLETTRRRQEAGAKKKVRRSVVYVTNTVVKTRDRMGHTLVNQ